MRKKVLSHVLIVIFMFTITFDVLTSQYVRRLLLPSESKGVTAIYDKENPTRKTITITRKKKLENETQVVEHIVENQKIRKSDAGNIDAEKLLKAHDIYEEYMADLEHDKKILDEMIASVPSNTDDLDQVKAVWNFASAHRISEFEISVERSLGERLYDYLKNTDLLDNYETNYNVSGYKLSISDYNLSANIKYRENRMEEAFVDYFVDKTEREENIIKTPMTDEEKEEAIINWICENVSYDKNYEYVNSFDAITSKRTVCLGYSQLFDKMAKKAGLTTCIIVGKNNEYHSWNMIKLDGEWVHLDLTNVDNENNDIAFINSMYINASDFIFPALYDNIEYNLPSMVLNDE